MKTKLPIIAIMAVTSQLALAEAANDPHMHDAQSANETTSALETSNQAITAGAQSTGEVKAASAVTASALPPLKVAVGASLQSKLEAQLKFELEPQPVHQREIASVD